MQGEPDERASNEEEAESRAYLRIASALERGDIDELAAALGQVPDPVWAWPEYYARAKKNESFCEPGCGSTT